jgi:asparagine synthase (glutamine-hydrolysing)
MSFIFGIVDFSNKPVKAEEIRALADGLKWEGFIDHTEVEGNVAYGFCSHLDRKAKTGIYRDDDLIVLADIRIYNNEKLKSTLDYTAPEEAFAKAYRSWGVECAEHINGDFAAMIYDRKKKAVHLIRDHIGARPLVYWFSGCRLIFASHEFGLVRSGLVRTGLSEEKLIDSFFQYRQYYEQTVFRQVLKVVPGHSVSFFADGRRHIAKYWKPENIQKNKALTFETAVTRLRGLIVAATRNRMEQGRTGLHVSGGLDSCGVASIVADYTPDKSLLTGYSWTPEVFDGAVDGVNEKEFIAAFCDDKKVRVKYLNLGEDETVKNSILPEFERQHIEHPVMQMACEDGVETVFSGWGGDEFVSLSTRGTFNHLVFGFKWSALPGYVREKGIKSTLGQFRTDLFPCLVPFGLLPVYKIQYTDWSLLRLLPPDFIRGSWKQIFLHRRKNIYGCGDRMRFVLNLIELRHLPERMESWAINAERYGFEYKYPLLDKDVLEFWFSLPVEYTYRDFHSRLLFREALKGILTEKIRTRKDKGEALRIAYSQQERQNGKKYLERLFRSLSGQDHLPFFRPEALMKDMNLPQSRDELKNLRIMNKLTCYLRYVALTKKYLASGRAPYL